MVFLAKKATPADITGSKILMKRVEAVRQMRLDSKGKTTNGYAKVPHLFAQITQPDDVDFWQFHVLLLKEENMFQ